MDMILYGVIGVIILVAIIAVVIIALGGRDGNSQPKAPKPPKENKKDLKPLDQRPDVRATGPNTGFPGTPPVQGAGVGAVMPGPPPGVSEEQLQQVPLSADQRAMLYHGDRPPVHVVHTPFEIGRQYPGRPRNPDFDTEQFIGLYGSRRHAMILFDFKSGQFVIEDRGSKNGTFVNERFLPPGQRQVLQDQDKIWITDKLELIFKDPRSVGALPTVGHLRIRGLVAKGGMAEVFKAQDNEGRFFAVKVPIEYKGESDIARELRLEDEYRVLSSMQSPRAPRVFELTRAQDGRQALIMEFLEGQTLRTYLQTNKVDPQSAVSIVGSIAEGLRALHSSGYVHCDIKPDNIMMRKTVHTGSDVARNAVIIDFGIAMPDRSLVKNPFGSANYQSPEHIKGELLTFKSDVYSLGCVLYELLTDGERLYPDAQDLDQIKQFQVNKIPTPPAEVVRRKNLAKVISPEVDKLTMDMLDKSAASRPDLNSVLSRISRLVPNVV